MQAVMNSLDSIKGLLQWGRNNWCRRVPLDVKIMYNL